MIEAVIRRFLGSAAERGWTAFREGRLPLSPSLWLRHLKNHWVELSDVPRDDSLDRIKAAFAGDQQAELRAFLESGKRLALPTATDPQLSILIVAFNRPELLLACLRSLASATPFEVVIVDNGGTGAVIDLIDGAQILRPGQNLGFPAAVNRAAKLARGRNLLLLNHDAALLPGSLDAALAALGHDVGAVGARLVLPDGRLQEAGSIIRRDGSCLGWGRGQPPDAAQFRFRRDVDFCSGAFLLTPRARFEELNGLDEGYGPAYYEEVDYCVRLWKRGQRVVYEPSAVVAHFEFASTPSANQAMRMQAERRARFVAAHSDWLAAQPAGGLIARSRSRGLRILVIDDRVPHPHLGSGFPRAQSLIRALAAEGHEVTFLPLLWPEDDWAQIASTLPATVEVMVGVGRNGLAQFLEERRGHYHRTIVSRPNNLRALRGCENLIYDAEALFALRDGTDPKEEIELARGARAILTVSEDERRHFAAVAPSFTLGHALLPTPTPSPFAERRGILFVGAFHHDHSPNSEEMLWFMREVMPRLGDLPLTIVGHRPPRALKNVHEHIGDLTPLYDRARLFVAPIRRGAGLPYKVHHAAAHGLPVVGTPLLAKQLDWKDEMLVADSAEEFAARCLELHEDQALWQRLRAAALARIERDCSPSAFAAALREALR